MMADHFRAFDFVASHLDSPGSHQPHGGRTDTKAMEHTTRILLLIILPPSTFFF